MMLSHNDLMSLLRDMDSLVYSKHYEFTSEERERYNAIRKKLGWCSVREPDYSGSPGNMS